jgi:hypothetical protein
MGVSYTNIVRPGAALQAANNTQTGSSPGATSPLALHIEQFAGIVEGTIARKSIMRNFVPVRNVRGTSTISGFQVGESTLAKVTPGTEPDGSINQATKNKLTIDTLVNARAITPLLDDFQSSYDAKKQIGEEHGKKIAKFFDQAFMIQAIKAAQMTASGLPNGWQGGTALGMSAAGDELDAQKLEFRILDMFAAMADKDVDVVEDDCVMVLRPAQFYTLLKNNRLVDKELITSDGTVIKTKAMSAAGVPLYFSNNLPNTNVTGHYLSNAGNSSAYDIDATKALGVVFNPKAFLAGETIPLESDVFYDKKSKSWFIDAHLAFGVAPANPQYAGYLSKF